MNAVSSAGGGARRRRVRVTTLDATFFIPNLNDGPVGAVCSFPVSVNQIASGGLKTITFHGQGVGYSATTAGHITNEYVNLDTGKTLTVNVSGPVRISLDGSGLPVKGTGPQVVWEPIDQGGIRLIKGSLQFVPVDYGFGTVLHANVKAGTETNLCDALA